MKLGSIYHIVFLDHVAGGDEPYLCEVFGRLLNDTPNSITIGSWTIVDDLSDENREVFCILKSTIQKKKLLK